MGELPRPRTTEEQYLAGIVGALSALLDEVRGLRRDLAQALASSGPGEVILAGEPGSFAMPEEMSAWPSGAVDIEEPAKSSRRRRR